MLTGRHSRCLTGQSSNSSKKGSKSFVIRGQQLQRSGTASLKSSSSFSFCSCTCKCHQCCGELADTLNLQLKDLQNQYDNLLVLSKNKTDLEENNHSTVDVNLRITGSGSKIRLEENTRATGDADLEITGLLTKTTIEENNRITEGADVEVTELLVEHNIKVEENTHSAVAAELEIAELKNRIEVQQETLKLHENSAIDAELEIAELKNRIEVQQETLKLHENCTSLIDELSTKMSRLSEKIESLETEISESNSHHLVEVSNLKERLTMDLQRQDENSDTRYKELEAKHKLELERLIAKHKEELKAKDNVIAILKGDLAKSFDSNARERKEQIDELLRQVRRVSAEAEEAQAALMELKQQKEQEQDTCSNCFSMQKEVQVLRQRIQGKDDAIQDLSAICGKMKNQLVFQVVMSDSFELQRKEDDDD